MLYQFGTIPNDGSYPGPLIQASDGNLYGVTAGGGTANLGTIFSISPTGTYKQIYSFQGGADGSMPSVALVQAQDGYIYGVSATNSVPGHQSDLPHLARRFNPSGCLHVRPRRATLRHACPRPARSSLR